MMSTPQAIPHHWHTIMDQWLTQQLATTQSHAKPTPDRPTSPVSTLLTAMASQTDRAQANNNLAAPKASEPLTEYVFKAPKKTHPPSIEVRIHHPHAKPDLAERSEVPLPNVAGQSNPGHPSPAPAYCGGNDCPAHLTTEFGPPPRIQGSLLAKPSGTASGTRSFTNSQTGG